MADRSKTIFSIFKDIFTSAFAGHEPEGVGVASGEGAVKMVGPSIIGSSSYGGDMQVPGMGVSPKDLPMRETGEVFGAGVDIYSRRQRYSQYEMLEDMIAEVDATLNTYADEASSYDENDHTMRVKCNDSKIKEEAEFMLFKCCKIDNKIWGFVRNLCRDGDLFLEGIIDENVPELGILGIQELDPGTMWRIQSNRGKLLEFQQSMYGPDYNVVVKDLVARASRDNKPDEFIFWSHRSSKQPHVIRFAPAQILHMRIGGRKRGFYPYGVSILAPARRPALNLKLMEDAMLVYRVSRAAERRVYYIDVGSLAGPDVNAFVKSFQDSVKRKKVYSERTQSVDEMWNPMPVRRTTPVPLLDGRAPTIEELAREFEAGKVNWVYSVLDQSGGHVVPGKIVWCGKNYRCNNMRRIWFDDGGYVDFAPEHPLVMRDGSKKRADELVSGDSVMPLYIKLNDSEMKQYVLATESVPLNHQVVRVETLKDEDDVYCMTVVGPNGEEDRHNFAVHMHGSDGTIFCCNSIDDDLFLPVRPSGGTRVETLPGACLALDTRIPLLDGRVLSLSEMIAEHEAGKQNWIYSCDPDTGHIVPGIVSWAGVTRRNTDVVKITLDNSQTVICTPDHKFPVIGKGFVEAKDLAIGESMIPFNTHQEKINHKIVSIETLEQRIDTGTLTIDTDETYHNYHTFALESGIFVKNSNLSEIDDTIYFRKKLYISVKIPPGFLDQTVESQTNRLALTSIDMRFAKVVLRIQKELSAGFTELCHRHFELQKTPRTAYEDLEVIMTPSSDWKEMARSEVVRDRVERAMAANGLNMFDDKFIMMEYLKMPEDQAEEQIKMRRKQEIEKAEVAAQVQMVGAKAQMEVDRANAVNQARSQQAVAELGGATTEAPEATPGATTPTEEEIGAAMPPESGTMPLETVPTEEIPSVETPALTPSDREVEIEDRNL